MRNYIGHIIDYYDGTLTDSKRNWFEKELVLNTELRSEYKHFKQINDVMRGKVDLDEVHNDINNKRIDILTHQMVSDFHENSNRFASAKEFVSNSLLDNITGIEAEKNLDEMIHESSQHGINEITKSWVEDWNRKAHKSKGEVDNRRDFITSSLNEDVQVDKALKVRPKNIVTIRTVGFAAAALIALFLVIKTLSPSDSPENLYKEFYKPLNAYATTTRNSANTTDPFSTAVEKYKQGQYQLAGTMFSNLIYEDPNNIAFRFFSGITYIELGNYEQSILLLNEVISKNREYKKEAQWYLGLTYLKIGEIGKATSYLNELSQSEGYYQNQALNLLNRLK